MDRTEREGNSVYEASSFRRDDETPDRIFYRKARLVEHLDKKALRTVEHVIGTLIIEPRPRILDLMASWDSHIPDLVNPELVVGLGLNGEELLANPKLGLRMIQDINEHPVLPFPEASFDIVLNTVSVDYITKPLEVFSEVGRILRPGGLFLVIFSNRYFPPRSSTYGRGSRSKRDCSSLQTISLKVAFSRSHLFSSPRERGVLLTTNIRISISQVTPCTLCMRRKRGPLAQGPKGPNHSTRRFPDRHLTPL